jgi:hypothetical protein
VLTEFFCPRLKKKNASIVEIPRQRKVKVRFLKNVFIHITPLCNQITIIKGKNPYCVIKNKK